jgi:hypothetical protein
MIFAISLLSIGFVYGESLLIRKMGLISTPKTVNFVIPSKGQYRLGEIFPMKIEITGIETPINAVQADLGFDASKLEVTHISTQGSFADIFIQKEINNEVGFARLTGGLPNPGFFSDRGLFGTVYFRAKQPGLVVIEFLPTSLVLANDAKGTNVLQKLDQVSYLILPEEISEEEKQMQRDLTRMTSGVLGIEHDTTQLTFFEDDQILGVQEDITEDITSASNSKDGLIRRLLDSSIVPIQNWFNLSKKTILYLTPVFIGVLILVVFANKFIFRKGKD